MPVLSSCPYTELSLPNDGTTPHLDIASNKEL